MRREWRRYAILIAVAMASGLGEARAAAPTDLKATFRSGQVFITWKEVAGAKEYLVYRDTRKLRAATLDAKHLVAKVPQGSSRNMGLEDIAKGKKLKSTDPPFTITRNVVEPISDDAVGQARQLGADQGVVVLTTHRNGRYYYAVTAGGDRTLGAPNTAGPVDEKVETPEPLLIWQAKTKFARVYFQYRDLDDWNDSMSNIYAFPYWVGVKQNHRPGGRTKSLRVYLGGYYGPIGGANFARYNDVTIRTHEAGCWWWGFSSTYQYNRKTYHHGSGSPKPDKGPMKNYVQARYIDFVRWLVKQPYYSIDPEWVHTFGGSMGGVGSLLMLMDYPDVFAYGEAKVPPTNMLETKWQWLRNCEAKFGGAANDALKVDFHGPDAARLRGKWGDITVHEFLNLEKRMKRLEGEELPFIWMGSAGRDRSVNWPAQGRGMYPLLDMTRRAWSGGLKGGAGHHALGGDGGGLKFPRQLRTIRRNQSFPAFSNVSGNPKLPLPAQPENKFYQFNSQFKWSSSTYAVSGVKEQIDTPERYEIVISSSAGDQTADVTPRRLQRFRLRSGGKYLMLNTDVNDKAKVIQSQTVTADRFALVTFKEFAVKANGSRLIVTPAR